MREAPPVPPCCAEDSQNGSCDPCKRSLFLSPLRTPCTLRAAVVVRGSHSTLHTFSLGSHIYTAVPCSRTGTGEAMPARWSPLPRGGFGTSLGKYDLYHVRLYHSWQ